MTPDKYPRTTKTSMAEQKQNRNPDIAILLYRMDELKDQNAELKTLVEAGFVRQEGRVTALEGRVVSLENTRAADIARRAEEERNLSSQPSELQSNLFKLLFLLLAILAGVLGINQTGLFR